MGGGYTIDLRCLWGSPQTAFFFSRQVVSMLRGKLGALVFPFHFGQEGLADGAQVVGEAAAVPALDDMGGKFVGSLRGFRVLS